MTHQPEATPVIDAEREIGEAVFRRIAELRREPFSLRQFELSELRALEAIVLAVTGKKS
jgi:hypothetical protein